jgi:hypothetical protein
MVEWMVYALARVLLVVDRKGALHRYLSIEASYEVLGKIVKKGEVGQ